MKWGSRCKLFYRQGHQWNDTGWSENEQTLSLHSRSNLFPSSPGKMTIISGWILYQLIIQFLCVYVNSIFTHIPLYTVAARMCNWRIYWTPINFHEAYLFFLSILPLSPRLTSISSFWFLKWCFLSSGGKWFQPVLKENREEW